MLKTKAGNGVGDGHGGRVAPSAGGSRGKGGVGEGGVGEGGEGEEGEGEGEAIWAQIVGVVAGYHVRGGSGPGGLGGRGYGEEDALHGRGAEDESEECGCDHGRVRRLYMVNNNYL